MIWKLQLSEPPFLGFVLFLKSHYTKVEEATITGRSSLLLGVSKPWLEGLLVRIGPKALGSRSVRHCYITNHSRVYGSKQNYLPSSWFWGSALWVSLAGQFSTLDWIYSRVYSQPLDQLGTASAVTFTLKKAGFPQQRGGSQRSERNGHSLAHCHCILSAKASHRPTKIQGGGGKTSHLDGRI